jgi:multidrug efflux pump subunit AcrA (membrane-fusion protein)
MTVARADLDMLREADRLRSPVAGVVQSVAVANGDWVAAGKIVATVQPETGSWLRAVIYGDPLPAGTSGSFTPGNGGAPVRVTLRGALGMAQPDGGLPVALVPEHEVPPGASGTVTLDLPAQRVTLVPSAALILDKGRWWVMLHKNEGDQPVQVTPGPAHGYDTVIRSGLRAGQDVVVTNAYLLYHRGVAAVYRPPD